MASETPTDSTFLHRVSDITTEPHTMLMPIEGYEKMPLVSLEEAVEPLVPLVRDVRRRAWIAKQRCENPPDNLTIDESASITLYTVEWTPCSDSLYFILNSTLRTEDRTKLKPWFLYLKLLLTALCRLPSIGTRTFYRGVRLDLHHLYPKDKTFIWWGFSSCTASINVLEVDHFFGNNHARTLFTIESNSGRDIHQHSYFQTENEVLLLPATQFTVVACLNQGPDLHIIQLKETDPLFPLLGSLPDHHLSVAATPKPKLPKPWLFIRNLSATSEDRRNSRMQKLIAKYELKSVINLDRQSLTDQDIPMVVQQAVIEKQCRMLRLSNNNIKSPGVSILAEALHNNTTLEGLYLFDNRVADSGVYFLAQALSVRNFFLKALSLGRNDITDRGAEHLAEMLKTNRTLTELCLPWNHISDEGVQLLANSLIYHNRTLKNLSIELNKLVGDASVDVLIDVINRNQSLNTLNVYDCKFSKAGKTRLHEVAKLRKNMQLNL